MTLIPSRGYGPRMPWDARACGCGPNSSTMACTRPPASLARRSPFGIKSSRRGLEALEAFHKKMPDPVRREKSWENITKGVESRYLAEAVRRFDQLLDDMETALADSTWLAGNEFSLADIGYAPYITRLDHLQMQFLWDNRPHIPAWYDRLRERRGYTEGLKKWFNVNYLPRMKEKSLEVRDKVKAIVG